MFIFCCYCLHLRLKKGIKIQSLVLGGKWLEINWTCTPTTESQQERTEFWFCLDLLWIIIINFPKINVELQTHNSIPLQYKQFIIKVTRKPSQTKSITTLNSPCFCRQGDQAFWSSPETSCTAPSASYIFLFHSVKCFLLLALHVQVCDHRWNKGYFSIAGLECFI